MTYFHGYCPDLEDVQSLRAGATFRDLDALCTASYDKPLDSHLREELRSSVAIEHQGRTNSCYGHMASTLVELALRLKTGAWEQLSRWAAYIWAQDMAGMNTDSGAYLDAGFRSLMQDGIPAEPLWMFSGKYHRTPPGGTEALRICREDAKRRRLTAYQPLRNYAEIWQWLTSGQGGVAAAVPWYSNWYTISREGVLPAPAGSATGFHAYPLTWSTRRREGSRYYLEGPNSWGTDWGNGGFAEWSPSLIDFLFRQRGVQFFGLSDMAGDAARPRRFDRRKDAWFLK